MTPSVTADLPRSFDQKTIDALRDRIEATHQVLIRGAAPIGQVPLHIACYASDCRNGLHCLNYARRGSAGSAQGGGSFTPGECRACRQAVAELPAERAMTVDAIADLFHMQRRELIREHYWKAPLDRWAYNQAHRLGRIGLRDKARRVIANRIGRAEHPREGRQTGWNRDVVAYAQHAVAACCRECVFYWHGISLGRPLSDSELTYLSDLALLYLDLRLPDLPDESSDPGRILTSSLPPASDPFDLRASLRLLLDEGQSPAGLTVPASQFRLLKTESVVNDGMGSVSMRPVAEQQRLGPNGTAEAG